MIKVYRNVLDIDTCARIRELSDAHGRAIEGAYVSCVKYMNLEEEPEWSTIFEAIQATYERYRSDVDIRTLALVNSMESPSVFRYDADRSHRFTMHADAWDMRSASRTVTLIFYLNDVEQGGETRFAKGDLDIAPEEGSVLCFPSSCAFEHEGRPPSTGSKYVMVTWLHLDGDSHGFRMHRLGHLLGEP